MSARAARLLAAFLHFAESLWLRPLSWRIEQGWLGFVTFFAVSAFTLALPLGSDLLRTRSARRRTSGWRIDSGQRRFVPGRRYRTGTEHQ